MTNSDQLNTEENDDKLDEGIRTYYILLNMFLQKIQFQKMKVLATELLA